MAQPLVSDDLWAVVAPLLPSEPPKPTGGRPRVPDRACLTGLSFVLTSGIPWQMLPQALAGGSGVPCWRRRRDWQVAGGGIAALGSSSTAAGRPPRSTGRGQVWTARVCRPKGGPAVGPTPTDRGKAGTKRHLITARTGIPLAALLSPANRHDSMRFTELLDAVPPIKTPAGRRRRRPAKVHADQGYADRKCRLALRRRPLKVRIARNGIDSRQRLGRHRWVVERTFAWRNRVRRLTLRDERRADIQQALLSLGWALICWNFRS